MSHTRRRICRRRDVIKSTNPPNLDPLRIGGICFACDSAQILRFLLDLAHLATLKIHHGPPTSRPCGFARYLQKTRHRSARNWSMSNPSASAAPPTHRTPRPEICQARTSTASSWPKVITYAEAKSSFGRNSRPSFLASKYSCTSWRNSHSVPNGSILMATPES